MSAAAPVVLEGRGRLLPSRFVRLATFGRVLQVSDCFAVLLPSDDRRREPESPDNAALGVGPAKGPEGPPGFVSAATAAGADQPKKFTLRKYPFVIQFAWQPQPRTLRQEKMGQKKTAEAGTAATDQAATATGPHS